MLFPSDISSLRSVRSAQVKKDFGFELYESELQYDGGPTRLRLFGMTGNELLADQINLEYRIS